MTRFEELPCTLDAGVAARAAIGLVTLATDQTMEYEFRRLVPTEGIGLYVSRVWNDAEITPETLRAIGQGIAPSLELILPGLPLDVVGFGCTSATMTLGEEAVFAEIRKVRPDVLCTTPITAAFAAFEALGAKRIGIITPYAEAVNRVMAAYFEGRGMAVGGFVTFNKLDDREAARISLGSIGAAVETLAARGSIDAVFISCTSLRLSESVEAIEAAAGLPVTSSDHALAWHCLRLAGISDPVPGAGRLFRLPL